MKEYQRNYSPVFFLIGRHTVPQYLIIPNDIVIFSATTVKNHRPHTTILIGKLLSLVCTEILYLNLHPILKNKQ